MPDLNGKTIAFLVAPEGIEQVELTEPWEAVEEAGGTPRLLSTETGEVQAFNHLDKADTFHVDSRVARRRPRVVRRRWCCPAAWPTPTRCAWTRTPSTSCGRSSTSGKPVAAICHAPWTLVEADVVRGRQDDVVAEPADRPPQRRRRRGSTRRSSSTATW